MHTSARGPSTRANFSTRSAGCCEGRCAPMIATPGRRLRVLVVDDSETQRSVLATLLGSDPELEIVGQAADGLEAVHRAALLRPDVITIDLQMPGLDGIAATRRIMEETPTPVVLVAAGVSPDDRRLAGEALAAGVLAIVPKPALGSWDDPAAAEWLPTVNRRAQVRVIGRWSPERFPAGQLPLPANGAGTGNLGGPAPAVPPLLVAIGASTGGPQALQAILTGLPAT